MNTVFLVQLLTVKRTDFGVFPTSTLFCCIFKKKMFCIVYIKHIYELFVYLLHFKSCVLCFFVVAGFD